MQSQWTPHWNTHMHILEASITRVVLSFSCLSQYFANTITIFCWYNIIIITALIYRIAGKFVKVFFNFFYIAIWRSRKKSPKQFLSILNPMMLASWLPNYWIHYAMHQYFKKETCILPRECNVRDFSLSLSLRIEKFVSLTRVWDIL